MSHEVEREIELKQQIWRIEGHIIWYLMQVLYFWTYLLFGKAQNQSGHGLTGRTTDYGLVTGSEAVCFLKRLAGGLSSCWDRSYPEVLGWIRTRLAFAILRATGLYVRGSRSKWRYLSLKDGVAINNLTWLILTWLAISCVAFFSCLFILFCFVVLFIVSLFGFPLFLFLNQAQASHRPVCAWFLKIVSVQTSVCVCVCVCPQGY